MKSPRREKVALSECERENRFERRYTPNGFFVTLECDNSYLLWFAALCIPFLAPAVSSRSTRHPYYMGTVIHVYVILNAVDSAKVYIHTVKTNAILIHVYDRMLSRN